MLSKKDLILAKKTFEANKYRFEAKNAGRVYTPAGTGQRQSQSRMESSEGQRPRTMQNSRSMGDVRSGASGQTISLTRLEEMDEQQAQAQAQGHALPHIDTTSAPASARPKTSQTLLATSPIKGGHGHGGGGKLNAKSKSAHDMTAEELIAELANRGMTNTMMVKKQTLQVADRLRAKSGKVDYTDPDFDFEAMQKEDYYMPKVVITRPDGATLMDIYRSKQKDTWSLILKSQLKQEAAEKIVEKQKHDEHNETYGRLLKEQLAANLKRDQAGDAEGERLAAVVEATSKAKDDEMKARKSDSVHRQKQFISNALEDIETKRQKREAELQFELEAAMKTNNKVRAAIARDGLLKEQKKEKEAGRLASLWEENQAELAKKAELKRLDGENTLRIFKIGAEKYRLEDEARAASLASKLKASADGPAHSITAAATQGFRKREDEFFRMNETRENMLNKQLMASEAANNARAKGQGALLLAEWDKNMAEKKKLNDDLEERNMRILDTMKQMKLKGDLEDMEKREKKRLAGLRYQRELDMQLAISRERSKDSLQKTMSDRERRYNSALLLQTGLISDVTELV